MRVCVCVCDKQCPPGRATERKSGCSTLSLQPTLGRLGPSTSSSISIKRMYAELVKPKGHTFSCVFASLSLSMGCLWQLFELRVRKHRLCLRFELRCAVQTPNKPLDHQVPTAPSTTAYLHLEAKDRDGIEVLVCQGTCQARMRELLSRARGRGPVRFSLGGSLRAERTRKEALGAGPGPGRGCASLGNALQVRSSSFQTKAECACESSTQRRIARAPLSGPGSGGTMTASQESFQLPWPLKARNSPACTEGGTSGQAKSLLTALELGPAQARPCTWARP